MALTPPTPSLASPLATGGPPSGPALWRRAGPAAAALVVLLGAAPGLVRLPPIDRDEARFAQSSAQMLETGDMVDIRFQDAARDKKPVGINWLQALSVRALSSVERREIWAYRLPSLIGAMIAAAACAWGAQALFEPRRAVLAGVILGCGWLLSSEAVMAKTDAVLCAAVTLAMAALCRIYVRQASGGSGARPGERAALWGGLALGLLVKGPVAPALVALTLLALAAVDRRIGWMRRLSWRWGLLFTALVAAPWAAAITVSTDGSFWSRSASEDVVAKLVGGQQHHGGAPGLYLLASPLLVFPAACLAPAALIWGWRRRREAGVRFGLAWLVPGWLLFEAAPTKLPNYVLPLLGGFAMLCAGALSEPIGPRSRWFGAGLSVLAGAAIAAGAVWFSLQLGQAGGWEIATAGLALLAGLAGAAGVLAETRPARARFDLRAGGLICAGALGVAGHAVLVGRLLPSLRAAWPSAQAAELVARAGLDPRNGVTPGPVATAGYAEPSLVFLLGTDVELDDGVQAARALESGRPALVETRQSAAFTGQLARDRGKALRVGAVRGFDYSNGRRVELTLWRLAGG